MALVTIMVVEIVELLNESGLSSLLEGEDARVTQVFFEDDLCRETHRELLSDSDDGSSYTFL